ncbi:hypothetical protein [Burkholderia pseudomallei]|uniref:hypothetical protein n=1 Tax=Burkholderia pseudomallei TaxID=28450 RepID=UPI0011078277|nr:hypothetical protein [Burkholderia pseudomallei]MBO2974550.1 hypothetical protein [Burkholderia pseudomallei]MBO7755626.1 hypothetical protein [Burkholderia pseudomallei]MBO7820526.1 hypothetical protein [Burkholderia pseudomallei]MBO7856403.1 hypothetical protein [Burkholderia pseudomallei]MBO7886421.1 hypothetical protein [Burkholderia pseudomallei]
MATINLKTRIKRLERAARGGGAGSGIETLTVRIRRLWAADGAFTGIRANSEFFPCAPGEAIAETERRVVDLVSRRRGPIESHRQVVRLRMTPVEELPE